VVRAGLFDAAGVGDLADEEGAGIRAEEDGADIADDGGGFVMSSHRRCERSDAIHF